MRMVYAHFPISINIEAGGKKVAVRNFLGEKRVREVTMLDGVEVSRSAVRFCASVRARLHG
jgi:large subunit ribosomal protein L9e